MPTKKKRVGFIPREEVMKIIDDLSMQNNLSNSKIISILVEEALSIRGIYSKNNGKVSQSYQQNNDHLRNLIDNSADFVYNSKPFIDTKLGNQINPDKSKDINGANQEDVDLQTYKKFLSFLKFQEMIDKYNSL